MAIPVKLPVFEGPLDLLMHLIEKNKIDIYDIPIVEITDQYLEYVHQMDHEDMDVTSEFLVMAATLLDIKSRMLLPREKDEETGEEEGDPREELVRRLLEYKMFKYLSEELAVCREQAGVRYFRAQDLPKEVRSYQPPIDYEDLLKDTDIKKLETVFGEVLRRKKSRRDPIRSGFGKIRREEVNIDTKTLYIRAYLQAHPRTDFRALLESQESKEEVIVTFLILLELMKVQKVHIVQDSICGKILIEAAAPAENSEPAAEESDIPSEPVENSEPTIGEPEVSAPPENSEPTIGEPDSDEECDTDDPENAATETEADEINSDETAEPDSDEECDTDEEFEDFSPEPTLIEKSLTEGPFFNDFELEELLMEETLEELAEEEKNAEENNGTGSVINTDYNPETVPVETDEEANDSPSSLSEPMEADDDNDIPEENQKTKPDTGDSAPEKNLETETDDGDNAPADHRETRPDTGDNTLEENPETETDNGDNAPAENPGLMSLSIYNRFEVVSSLEATAAIHSIAVLPPAEITPEEELVPPAEIAAEEELAPPTEAAAEEEIVPPAEVNDEEEVLPPVEAALEEDVLPPAEVSAEEELLPPAEVVEVAAEEEFVPPAEAAFEEETAPAAFSLHLWYGKLPKHVSPRFNFSKESVRSLKFSGQAVCYRLCRKDPLWEQRRFSRMWERRR